MILKRYGSKVESVEMNFRGSAMTEVGFRRTRETTIPWDEFQAGWTKVEERTFASLKRGDVQVEVEQAMLDEMAAEIQYFDEMLPITEALFVESESGVDYPKVHLESRGVIIDGENRLEFHGRIDPGLRLGRYRQR